jgi:hypothetical protein
VGEPEAKRTARAGPSNFKGVPCGAGDKNGNSRARALRCCKCSPQAAIWAQGSAVRVDDVLASAAEDHRSIHS